VPPRRTFVATALFSLGAVVGCGSSTSSSDGGALDMAAAGGDSFVPTPFQVQMISGCGQGGFQTTAATSGKTVAFASFASTTSTQACTLAMGGTSQVPVYDLCYAESTSGGAFTTTKVVSPNYNALTGVGLALSSSGEAAVAFAGGMPGMFYCGGAQLMLSRRPAGGSFSAPQLIAANSMSSGLATSTSANCTGANQDVCNKGDVTGQWPAVAYDGSGQAAVAFRDVHYGFAMTDYDRSDLEFARGPGFSIFTADVARGGGSFNRLTFDGAGKPVAAYFNTQGGATLGLWIARPASATDWTTVQVSTATTAEQIGFGINAKGLYALAYYDQSRQRLTYVESSDGSTFASPVDVDVDGDVGRYPSLAFQSNGEPAIAYYRCNDYKPGNSNCDPNRDGLRLARRAQGNWQVQTISALPSITDGRYTALAYVDGKAVIAFQTQVFDPSSSSTQSTLNIAREP
jgi:hypothetical protein